MTYENAIHYINSLLKFGMNPGLDRIKKLLDLLGNPQDDLKIIHVAGTNGKGSTCAFISSVLKCAGFKTGLFISPFIVDFRERMQINGTMIPKEDFANVIDYIIPFVNNLQKSGEYITEFELITAAALFWFKKENCDIVILEVGLGGRLDATNVISKSLVSVITSISYDHMNVLGDTIEQIAMEKAGILKPNGILVLYPNQTEDVSSVITNIAKDLNNKIVIPDLTGITNLNFNLQSTEFIYKNEKFSIGLLGLYQVYNAITALSVINELISLGFNIPLDKIKCGLMQAKFPARFEIVSEMPPVILDGSHNPDGAKVLSQTLNLYMKNKRIIAIVGMLKDKDVKTVLQIVSPMISELIITQPNNNRAMDKLDLLRIAQEFNDNCIVAPNINEAVSIAFNRLNDESAVLVFGSLYLGSEIRPIIKNFISHNDNF